MNDTAYNFFHSQARIHDLAASFSHCIERQNWFAIVVIIFLTFLAERIFHFLFKNIVHLTKKTATDLDDKIVAAAKRPLCNYIVLAGLLILIFALKLPVAPVDFGSLLHTGVKILFILNTLWLLLRLTDVFGGHFLSKVSKTSSRLDDQLVPLFTKTTKILLFILCALIVLHALGYSISGVIAGLGIGGLAVAMAAKDTLSNFFGSIMIFSDRQFRVGDWIKVGDDEGIVEQIGLRSTRIRTFEKTLITIPNSLVANAPVNNYSKMHVRRVNMTIGISHAAGADQMEKLTTTIRDYLKNHPGVAPEAVMVNFVDFGESSLKMLVYYFTKTTVWDEHLKVKQEINLAIMRFIESMNLSLALPTRIVYVNSREEQ